MKSKLFVSILLPVLLMAVILALPVSAAPAQLGGVNPLQKTVVAYPVTAIAGTTTAYSDAQALSMSRGDPAVPEQVWQFADVFVSGTVVATKAATITVQFSPDGTLWTDGFREEVLNNVVTAVPLRALLSAGTSTKYFKIPQSTGEKMRFKIEHSGAVTPTISVTTHGW